MRHINKLLGFIFFILFFVSCGVSPKEWMPKTPMESSVLENSLQEISGTEIVTETVKWSVVPEQEKQEESVLSFQKKFPEEDTFFDYAMPTNGALTLSVYEDCSVISRTIYDKSTRERLLEELLNVEAERDEAWNPELAEMPVYIMWVWGKNGKLIEAAWSNGYWFSPNGVPYRFDFDFQELIAAYDWEEKKEINNIPFLLKWEGAGRDGWFPNVLWPSEELPVPEQGIMTQVVSVKDNILTIKITNNSEINWLYGDFFSLDVLLDGIWYDMVMIPDAWGFDDYALDLAAGETLEKEYDFTMYYGKLTEGIYRLCTGNKKMTVVFTVIE